MKPSDYTPVLVDGVDVRQLPLTAREGFVLSRIDGYSTVEDISSMTGGDLEVILDALDRLAELGAIAWKDGVAPNRPKPVAPPPEESPAPKPSIPARKKRATIPDGAALGLYPASLLDEDVEIDPERRKEILDTYHQLSSLSFYVLLGVPADAPRKDIRNAYFELSKRFHPDTLFRKRLGSYKPKMEAIFKKITEAYEVLGKNGTRAAYDDYLSLHKITRTAERELAEGGRMANIEARRSNPPPKPVPAAASFGPSQPALPIPTFEDAERQSSPDARKQRAAERLGKGLGSAPPAPGQGVNSAARPFVETASGHHYPVPPEPRLPMMPPMPSFGDERSTGTLAGLPSDPGGGAFDADRPTAVRPNVSQEMLRVTVPNHMSIPPGARPHGSMPGGARAAGEDLARSLAQLRGGAMPPIDLVRRHVDNARAAERAGNFVEAANTWRLAIAVAPQREDLQAELERVKVLLAGQLAPTYEKQAKIEEEMGRWKEAAQSWLNVLDGKPDNIPALERAVEAHIKAGLDLRRAQKLGTHWVELEPQNAKARLLLGRIYLSIGLRLNAKRELETAAKLDPTSEMVKNLLLELQKP